MADEEAEAGAYAAAEEGDAMAGGEGGGDDGDGAAAGAVGGAGEDAVGDDMEGLQRMMEQLEEENSNIISASSKAVEDAESTAAAKADRERLSRERDERSVFVAGVDVSAEESELAEQFASCGAIEKVLLVRDKMGQPKGCVRSPSFVVEACLGPHTCTSSRAEEAGAPRRCTKSGAFGERALFPVCWLPLLRERDAAEQHCDDPPSARGLPLRPLAPRPVARASKTIVVAGRSSSSSRDFSRGRSACAALRARSLTSLFARSGSALTRFSAALVDAQQ